jgi:hypothetical protein
MLKIADFTVDNNFTVAPESRNMQQTVPKYERVDVDNKRTPIAVILENETLQYNQDKRLFSFIISIRTNGYFYS